MVKYVYKIVNSGTNIRMLNDTALNIMSRAIFRNESKKKKLFVKKMKRISNRKECIQNFSSQRKRRKQNIYLYRHCGKKANLNVVAKKYTDKREHYGIQQ